MILVRLAVTFASNNSFARLSTEISIIRESIVRMSCICSA